ncbi:EAL domain-containing protein [Lachnospiraceae bacterium NSJ-143]|nr:EAL domain-containing protein [Lachnospiraceae bacterium NSJ-143]
MLIKKKILIVEDNQINREMLKGILSPDYIVLEAENGQEALFILKDYKDEISLILLDIVMPVMDGYTFLSIMKANPSFSSIPVIVTTQSDNESDEVTALSHGATDFVAKPYKPQVILHRVASIINLRETAAMINQFQYDHLTGLYSKEFFYQRVKEKLIQNPDKEYDIISSDIENFKLINDIFGVPAGNRLLCCVADIYINLVGEEGVCGRFNADQFACLLERKGSYTDDFFVKAEEQLRLISNTKNVVVKWGVYIISDRTLPVEKMCDRAILTARSIKGQYGKHFAIYNEELRDKLLREQAITDSMETALAEGQFVIYLQPKYSIKDDMLAGAEALVRWNHPEWGFLSPAEFIPLFEKNGFITKLDQFVWDRACAVLKRWQDLGYPVIPVSVNVSRADVYQADIADILRSAIKKYGLLPSRLHLEITESAYTENPEQIIDTVRHLREIGFVIEMDDFGTGYSSLNMLNQMPLDILKLDMKFIQSEMTKTEERGILRFIMNLARWMNLTVVAEGVETSEQLERLRNIGCDYVQGYYFAKPMPCEDFEQLIVKSMNTAETISENKDVFLQCDRRIMLVADESCEYRKKVKEEFCKEFVVVEAENGMAALKCINEYKFKIAVIILSLNLSEPDGLSVLEVLQKEKIVWNVPVIATAKQNERYEEMAFELGADDFAVKPHSMKSLNRRVLRIMKAGLSQERERLLVDEACHDYLTGLLNRRGLNTAIELLRKDEMPIAVYLFDLDNLKQINDKFGHMEGDRMLREFGAILNVYTRGSDILSRYGGDEFVVIIKHMVSEQAAIKKGEEICMALTESCTIQGFPTSCSAGIVVCSEEKNVSELITCADEALYRAKAGNKGGCYLWKGIDIC